MYLLRTLRCTQIIKYSPLEGVHKFSNIVGVKICTLYHYIAHLVNHPTYPKILRGTFELNLDKITNQSPYLIVALGDFNVKSYNWYKHNKTTYEGSKVDAITSQFGLQQIIK